MNWEPMTEDAVFEDRERLLVATEAYGEPWYEAVTYYPRRAEQEESFQCNYGMRRSDITHFCRITNPNNPSNTTKEQTT